MEQIELGLTGRKVLGKKVRFLRRKGITPVHVFGRSIESAALQCDAVELKRVLAQAGKTRLVSLKIDTENSPRVAVVREVQRQVMTGEVLHADFYQVEMTEKLKVGVPLALVGEAPALESKDNMLVQELNALTIECLPDRIPDRIEVDLTPLVELEQAVRVKDIQLGEGVTILDDQERVLVRIILRPVEKEEKPVVAEEAVEAPEAAASAEEAPKEE